MPLFSREKSSLKGRWRLETVQDMRSSSSNPVSCSETSIKIYGSKEEIRARKSPETVDAPGFAPDASIPVILYGAGDEARTRYLDLGKVALYQMSYARKRKMYYTANRIPCQPRLSFFRKISARPFRGGQNRLNASRSPPRRHWRRWDRSSSPSRCRRWRSAPVARSAAPGTPARQRH